MQAGDGTPIAFHTHGEAAGPTVLLTNGIGTTENFWRFLVADLVRDHSVVHWDYRGHGSTPLAASGDYSMRTQADDLARVTRQVMERGGPPPVHVGFSMGVAVLLELYRVHPELVRALVLIAGAPDAPGTGTWLFKLPGSLAAARALAFLATPVVPLLTPAFRAFVRSSLPYPAARLAGIIQPHAPKPDIDQFLAAMGRMDPIAYWRTLRALLGAHGSDVLAKVAVPVLIVAAAQDALMPLAQVQQMRAGLPHARYVEIQQAGHAGLLEKGPEMARAVRSLLADVER